MPIHQGILDDGATLLACHVASILVASLSMDLYLSDAHIALTNRADDYSVGALDCVCNSLQIGRCVTTALLVAAEGKPLEDLKS